MERKIASVTVRYIKQYDAVSTFKRFLGIK